MKIEVGDIPFPLTRLNFLLEYNLGESSHIAALEKKVPSQRVSELALKRLTRQKRSAKPSTSQTDLQKCPLMM